MIARPAMTQPTVRFITLGVYSSDEAAFFGALVSHNVDTFCDIRLRRGMRGSLYSFANSTALQKKLAELGIRYYHDRTVAPTQTTRDYQATADKQAGIARRSRTVLGEAFVTAYERQLNAFDATQFIKQFNTDARVICLFCVEKQPEACHRSLLAGHLQAAGFVVTHVVPA